MSLEAKYLNSQVIVSGCRHQFRKSGSFYRRCDFSYVRRFRCRICGKSFSQASSHPFFRQRLRRINGPLLELQASGVSQRRMAVIFRVNRKTVVRKFLILGRLCELKLVQQNAIEKPVQEMQFDDLETIEHTKCKPLSVCMAVEKSTRRILGFNVARMPAKGMLAKIARKKYGRRKDGRGSARKQLFRQLQPLVAGKAIIYSDDSPHYPQDVKNFFPDATHIAKKGGRSSVSGQGELKKQIYDPLFAINHSFAKLRADTNRLIRKTWCTTKLPESLRLHLNIVCVYHNHRLKDPKLKTPIFDWQSVPPKINSAL